MNTIFNKATALTLAAAMVAGGGMASLATTTTVRADESGVALTSENFPDATFLEKLKNYDTNADNMLSPSEYYDNDTKQYSITCYSGIENPI